MFVNACDDNDNCLVQRLKRFSIVFIIIIVNIIDYIDLTVRRAVV